MDYCHYFNWIQTRDVQTFPLELDCSDQYLVLVQVLVSTMRDIYHLISLFFTLKKSSYKSYFHLKFFKNHLCLLLFPSICYHSKMCKLPYLWNTIWSWFYFVYNILLYSYTYSLIFLNGVLGFWVFGAARQFRRCSEPFWSSQAGFLRV